MSLEAWLAAGHHLAAFTVLATLAAEWGVVRPGLTADDAARVRIVDACYGIAAAAVIAIGLARIFLGPMQSSFYFTSPFFWAKMATFATIGLLSIAGTTRYQRWAAEALGNPAWTPPASEVASTRMALVAQLALFPIIPVCAALMARGIGT